MTAAAIDLDADVDLVHVDPEQLVIGPNVRRDPQYSDLVASIREVGVLQPITAFWSADGELVVVLGQRRTLAAVEAGRDTVPVYVVPQPDDVHRLVDQYVENAHREGLTTADTVDTWHQLEALGVEPVAIAQRTTTPLERVQAGLRVARAPGAVGTLRQYPQTTLEQAVVLAEFEGDKDATNKLVKALEVDAGFEHVAQQLVDARAEQRMLDDLAAEIRAVGGVVVDVVPGWQPSTKEPVARIASLLDAEGNQLTVSKHESCDGHAAFVEATWTYEAGRSVRKVQAVHVCLDWQKYGHANPYRAVGGSPASNGDTAAAGGSAAKPSKAEKARVDAGDAAWVSATTVRRDWLNDLAKRTSPPAGAERYILERLLSDDLYAEYDPAAALRALGREVPTDTDNLEHPFLAEHKMPRLTLCSLWVLLESAEADLEEPNTWRSHWRLELATKHLRALAGFGYELAPIELALVDGTRWEPS